MADANRKSIFEPEANEEARLDAEAMAAYRAGRFVTHAKVAEWLDSWGKPGMQQGLVAAMRPSSPPDQALDLQA